MKMMAFCKLLAFSTHEKKLISWLWLWQSIFNGGWLDIKPEPHWNLTCNEHRVWVYEEHRQLRIGLTKDVNYQIFDYKRLFPKIAILCTNSAAFCTRHSPHFLYTFDTGNLKSSVFNIFFKMQSSSLKNVAIFYLHSSTCKKIEFLISSFNETWNKSLSLSSC